MAASLATFERPRPVAPNTMMIQQVFKSGPLFISSKGIGWKSWKKRWFILTRTSLVFFKNDPSALPQKGGEVNLTLGGIDLNNSGSVVVREDKKLLTVLFPDGRDGRAFTLKAETSEDLYEWKTALEHALAQAPSAAIVMGHNGIFRNDTNDTMEGSFPHQWKDKRPVKSSVIGRPILLALEDIDGSPSFLEKALRFLENFGTKVEGILRQCADVEEVERRVQEYEQGKIEFDPNEDAHVVGDCIKYVLRELPSSPVSAPCCTALFEAYKIDRKEARVSAMRSAIFETFPEPNRRLLQRVLKMMHIISSHSHENLMNPSAVAACMAPLLLRPLLTGDCGLDDFDGNGDNSVQLLAAANAATNAHAIVTTLLEEYENIFDDENLQRCSISADSRIENSGSEESTDDENIDMKDNGYHDAENEVDPETDDDPERVHSGKLSESSGYAGSDLYDYKTFGVDDSDVGSPKENHASAEGSNLCVDPQQVRDPIAQLIEEQGDQKKGNENSNELDHPSTSPAGESYRSMGEILSSMDPGHPLPLSGLESGPGKAMNKVSGGTNHNSKRSTFWGRSNVRKTPSMESVDSSGEEELAIQRLEIAKNDLQHRIAKEARGNAILQASLERRKQALHERRLALEQDVSRLQEQLQAERDLRAALEVGLSMSTGQFSSSRSMDSKTRAELEEIALAEADVARLKQKVAELHHQLNQQRQNHYGSLSDACDRYQHVQTHNSQQRFLQQDFDTSLAFCNHERKQRTTEESLLGTDWRNMKGQVLSSGSINRQPGRKPFMESTSLSDSKSTEASTSMSVDDLSAVDSAAVPSTSRAAEVADYPRHPSSALVELTTRLDFFKERRSQLMEQLHNLDLNYGTTSAQDFVYRPSSPPWN
ncbi:rho GTPase-activating protein 7-like isoform X1 [Cannabis sativa]|uniref:rho GTPase-activating protein 7-like isoform X1 n=1 Tax=Cannabis sativa TaxID=3483 RepID=UPI0029C9DD2B|nr:rho GTPase-activating protein 7-like isoform X1 [Cannabis sativa]XP_060966182.1 rho GTPase-activating protein 7-like isoform X1 [Cannabis sativa]